MLHFELWKEYLATSNEKYLGGNWFAEEKPENLLDPTDYMESITESIASQAGKILRREGMLAGQRANLKGMRVH
ncbi:hypothetical protein ACSAZK_01190 [Methanosarcina sp. Mfa9]|uniref:hypothetical protein n=1 Tax=Methanosarcina sp. Mfa9 TaxID=3439063 RepID=UPI003F86E5BF